MPLDAEESPLSTRLGALNKQYETQSAPDILEKRSPGLGALHLCRVLEPMRWFFCIWSQVLRRKRRFCLSIQ